MTSDAAQSTVPSSSSTLWAQASKEWVIPAKPKPGRKPKKDTAAPQEAQEVDSKGRRVQNRAAQRAFRERKQSQLAELQARVQSYEQGEIARNVALQQISKRLKEENEQLKGENTSLKEEIARLKERLATSSVLGPAVQSRADKEDRIKSLKRWRDESVTSNLSDDGNVLLEPGSSKRLRVETDSPRPSSSPTFQHAQAFTCIPSPPSIASSPGTNNVSRTSFSPLPFVPFPPPSGPSRGAPCYPISTVFSPPTGESLKSFDAVGSVPPFDTFDCGLCTENSPCLCREIAMQHTGNANGLASSLSDYGQALLAPPTRVAEIPKVEDVESLIEIQGSKIIEIPSVSEDADADAKASLLSGSSSSQTSASVARDTPTEHIRGNNGPFQIRLPSPSPAPAHDASSTSRSLPLRSRTARRLTSGKIWQVNFAPPTCSGDPSNCPACKDDDFGKAFCRALGDSAGTVAPACASCPNPEACGKAPCRASTSGPNCVSSASPSSTRDALQTIQLTLARPEQGYSDETMSSNFDRASGDISRLSISTPTSSSPSANDGKPPNSSERIPANEAWARLKSHPNIAFADLSMLADVVARRTKCSGPIAVINPALGSITPERDAARSPAVPDSEAVTATTQHDNGLRKKDSNPILLTDPHAHFRAQEQQRVQYSSAASSSAHPAPTRTVSSALSLGPRATGRPALVPQEELRECGRRRIREVDTAGVHEALRILDAQFGKHS